MRIRQSPNKLNLNSNMILFWICLKKMHTCQSIPQSSYGCCTPIIEKENESILVNYPWCINRCYGVRINFHKFPSIQNVFLYMYYKYKRSACKQRGTYDIAFCVEKDTIKRCLICMNHNCFISCRNLTFTCCNLSQDII